MFEPTAVFVLGVVAGGALVYLFTAAGGAIDFDGSEAEYVGLAVQLAALEECDGETLDCIESTANDNLAEWGLPIRIELPENAAADGADYDLTPEADVE